jgi:hypothetical protein
MNYIQGAEVTQSMIVQQNFTNKPYSAIELKDAETVISGT